MSEIGSVEKADEVASRRSARCRDEFRSGDPRELVATAISVAVGRQTSDENGKAESNSESRKDHTRRHEGIDKAFWWHIKLLDRVDRIHFLHEPSRRPGDRPAEGRIVVGIFTKHCKLPGD